MWASIWSALEVSFTRYAENAKGMFANAYKLCLLSRAFQTHSSMASTSPIVPACVSSDHEFNSNTSRIHVVPEVKISMELETPTSSMPSQRKENVLKGDNINSKTKSQGVFITWEDLWVTVVNGNKGSRAILQGLTGYARPGELLAIMGPSGCGKSTLLDALAGRLDSNTGQCGDILINGRKQALAYGTSAYVTQDDALITTLTIREAVYYSAQLQLPGSMSKQEKKERAEMTIKEMGLQDAMNTRIGGWGVKGLSGGQKRRVSICIEILTRPELLFLDEPTSGLDSAASYYVMSRIAQQREGRTIIASIHQPSTEVFSLFHKVCLLSSGRTVYFGPTSEANEFFALNNLPCPPLQNPSDHFLKNINKDFDEDMEVGSRKPTEEVISILINSYNSSDCYQEVRRQVAEICKNGGEALHKNKNHANFLVQCDVLTRRSFVNMFRDIGYYWMRLAVYIVLAIGLGSIYYDVGLSYGSIQARGSLLMFVATFLTFMATGGFPSFVEEMKVFQRERLNGHYGSSAFVVGNILSAIPYLLLVSLIPGLIVYFVSGLQGGLNGVEAVVERFIYFASILFVCMVLVESQMMIVASIVPNFLMGIITGAGIQGLMILGGGFFRLPNDLPKPFWKYPLYYIAFHRYAFQGLFKNEFEGRTFPNIPGAKPPRLSGEAILRDTWQVEMGHSKWVDLAILFEMVVAYRLIFFIIVKSGEKIRPVLRSLKAVRSNHAKHIMVNPTGPLSTSTSPQ